jgi:hypothetical protein
MIDSLWGFWVRSSGIMALIVGFLFLILFGFSTSRRKIALWIRLVCFVSLWLDLGMMLWIASQLW